MWRRAKRQAELFEEQSNAIHTPILSPKLQHDATRVLVLWMLALVQSSQKEVVDDQDHR